VVPSFDVIVAGLPTDGNGDLFLADTWPSGIPSGTTIYFQYLIADPVGVKHMAFSNAVSGTTP